MKPREAIFQFDASLGLRSYKDMGNGQAKHLPLKHELSVSHTPFVRECSTIKPVINAEIIGSKAS